jgi:hypothetical protein
MFPVNICQRKVIRQRHLVVATGNYGRQLETVQGLENSEQRWGQITTTVQAYQKKIIHGTLREKAAILIIFC